MECRWSLSYKIMEDMRVIILLVFLFVGCSPKINVAFLKSEEVELTVPSIQAENIFFKSSTRVPYSDLGNGVSLRYTINKGQSPEESVIFDSDLHVSESSVFYFQAYGDNVVASKPQELRVYKLGETVAKISEASECTKPYEGSVEILLDGTKGNNNFRSGKWLGYQKPVVEFFVELAEPSNLNGLAISTLQDQGAWIFAPEKIEVEFYLSNGEVVKKSEFFEEAGVNSKSGMKFLEVGGVEEVSEIKLKIYSLNEIPSWHPGKGTPPWLFLDEIILQ